MKYVLKHVTMVNNGRVAELVDASDLKSGIRTECGGSNPSSPTYEVSNDRIEERIDNEG